MSIVKGNLWNKARQVKRRMFPPPIILDNLMDCSFYQCNHDIINYHGFCGLSLDEIAEKNRICRIISDSAQSGDTVIDIGANIGFMSLYMARRVGPTGTVLGFEPGPEAYGLFLRNIYANVGVLGNAVKPFNMALTDMNGPVNLFINPRGGSDNQVHRDVEEYDSRVKIVVEGVTLDSFLDDRGIDRVSFIKMDTQGHEYYILKGGRKFLEAAKDIVIVAEYAPYLHAWNRFSQDDFYDLVVSLGFRIFDSKAPAIEIGNDVLKREYGMHTPGKFTDLVLRK